MNLSKPTIKFAQHRFTKTLCIGLISPFLVESAIGTDLCAKRDVQIQVRNGWAVVNCSDAHKVRRHHQYLVNSNSDLALHTLSARPGRSSESATAPGAFDCLLS